MIAIGSDAILALGWTLVHFLWQGLLIGCVTAVLLTLMRNARPGPRYTVACIALLACLAWPALGFYLRMQGSGDAADALPVDRFGAADTGGAAVATYLQDKLMWIVAAWAACAGALAVRIGLGLLWVRRVAHHYATDAHWQARVSRMADQFGITRTVRLRVVQDLASPLTAGWWRPVVLVPASLISGMPPHLLDALLAHELAHVRRLDYVVNLGQNVVETLLFYHPAVWWISRRIRVEREQIADDLAATQLGEPRRLALALSELERFQFSTHHLAQAANGGDLMTRITRLIRPDTQALNWKAAIPVLGLAAATLLTACATAPGTAPQAAPQATTGLKSPGVVDFASCSKPAWPAESHRNGHEGAVTLAFLIGADGTVKDSAVRQSSGHPALDEAARTGIAKCRFRPGKLDDGRPASAWVQVKYVWALK